MKIITDFQVQSIFKVFAKRQGFCVCKAFVNIGDEITWHCELGRIIKCPACRQGQPPMTKRAIQPVYERFEDRLTRAWQNCPDSICYGEPKRQHNRIRPKRKRSSGRFRRI